MSQRAPTSWRAVRSLARLTWRRALRDRGTILVAVIAIIPVVFTLLLSGRWQPDNGWSRAINVTFVPLFALLPPMVLAPLVAEEAGERTFSYLWSRPIPRWSVPVGKGLALAPLVCALFAVSMMICYLLIFGANTTELHRLGRGALAIGFGTLAAGLVSATIGVFLPKHAVAAAAAYLLVVDWPVGGIPFSVQNISMTHHIRELAGTGRGTELGVHLIWLAGFAAVATIVLVWRIRRVELGSSS